MMFIVEEPEIFYDKKENFLLKNETCKIIGLAVADFIGYEKIVIEVKSQSEIINENYKQTINYLAVSKLPIGLILNFGEDSLSFKRVILT